MERDLETLQVRLFRLMRALRRRFEQDLARHDLTFPQFMTLLSLEQAGEPLSLIHI